MTDEAGHSGFGQGRGGNEGFSGTPLWKIKDQMAAYREQAMKQALATTEVLEPADPPNVLVDAASGGAPADAGKKPLVRHVLVKDLNKVAARLKVDLPKANIFKDRAPMGLYALFDGQSCAGAPDPSAAEYCARNFHTKLLGNLARLPPDSASPTFVKAALIKTFEDLDMEMLNNQLEVVGGCGAAVGLLIGNVAFTAVLGRCRTVAAEVEKAEVRPVLTGKEQAEIEREDVLRLRRQGANVTETGDGLRLWHPGGATSSVTRSLGDRAWKTLQGGGLGSSLVLSTPEVQSMEVEGPDRHPFLLLASSPVGQALDARQLAALAGGFSMQPRAACGEIVDRTMDAHSGSGAASSAQCTVIEVAFLPARSGEKRGASAAGQVALAGQPAAKKAKLGAASVSSIRLRHILVKFLDPTQPNKPVDLNRKPVTRTRQEAEAMLRRAMKELQQVVSSSLIKPKDGTDLVVKQAAKFNVLAKELSDCMTAQKGGAVCGDIGWLLPEQLLQMRGNFKENVEVLKVGQWSDVTTSEQGIHLVQRIA